MSQLTEGLLALSHLERHALNLQPMSPKAIFDTRYADSLFGVFQRMHSSQVFEGSGIDLSIVRRIVDRHGATFFFTLSSGAGS